MRKNRHFEQRNIGALIAILCSVAFLSLRPMGPAHASLPLKLTPPVVVVPALPAHFLDEGLEKEAAVTAEQKNLRAYISDHFQLPAERAAEVVRHAFRASVETGVSARLLLAIIAVESSFDARAEYRGAKGLMQIQASAHQAEIQALGGAGSLFNVQKNLTLGAKILRDCLSRVGFNLHQGLLLYNGSTRASNPYADKVLREKAKLDIAATSYSEE